MVEVFTKYTMQHANVAHQWCIRPGTGSGLKLTCFDATTHDTVGKLVFSGAYGGTMEGIETQIEYWHVDDKSGILYLRCDNGKIYRILTQNVHEKRIDTKEGVIRRLTKKGVRKL
jgi:hypothetical protein